MGSWVDWVMKLTAILPQAEWVHGCDQSRCFVQGQLWCPMTVVHSWEETYVIWELVQRGWGAATVRRMSLSIRRV